MKKRPKPAMTRPGLLLSAALIALGSAHSVLADDVTMVVANESWLNPNVWSDNAAPSTGNDYFTAVTGNNILRSSPAGTMAGGNANFTGNSLTVVAGTVLLIKQLTGESASINGGAGNLIIDGGTVGFGPNNGGSSPTLDVNELQVTSTAGAELNVSSFTATTTVDGTLTGTGDLLISADASGDSVSLAAVDPAYAGTITVSEGVILDFGSDVSILGDLALDSVSGLNLDQSLTVNSFSFGGVPADAQTYTAAELNSRFGDGTQFIDGGGTLTVVTGPADRDGDGLADLWEDEWFGDFDGNPTDEELLIARGTQAQDPSLGADWDNDNDGADNETEETNLTDPLTPDSDFDGLDDGPEIDGSLNPYDDLGLFVGAGNGGAPTDPLVADSDGDGIFDGDEVTDNFSPFITNPNNDDTDSDGLSDPYEIANMLDPTDDGFTNVITGDPGDPDNGADGDPDLDDLVNIEEQDEGTDPQDPDSDDDDINDGDEVFGDLNSYDESGDLVGPPGAPTDPLSGDSDGDGILDGEEVVAGSDGFITNPNSADTDGDGFSDSFEVAEGTSPVDGGDTPTGFISVAASVPGITLPDTPSDGSGVLLTTAEFDMAGGNAVALLVTTEGLADQTTTFGATFAGQPMAAVTATQGAQSSTVFYLVDPATTSGTFVVTVDPNLTGVELAYSVVSLSGVPGVADMATAVSDITAPETPLEVSYTTGSSDGFVVGAAVNNDFNNARQLSIGFGNPDTDLLSHTNIDTSGHFHTHGRVPAAGPHTDGYLGQYQRTAIATVVFGVPAPTMTGIRVVSADFNETTGDFEVVYEGLDTSATYQWRRSAPGLDDFSTDIGGPVTPASPMETFTDSAPPLGEAFYRLFSEE